MSASSPVPAHDGAAERAERLWIAFSAALIGLFAGLIFYAVVQHGHHVGHSAPRQNPAEILARPEFAQPGLRRGEDGRLYASLVAQAFSFAPSELEVPLDEEIIFRLTSRDVIHGFQILGTAINVELIPGEIAELRYTFRRPGEFPIVCNQYCGLAHQNMIARIHVIDPAGERLVEESTPAETDPLASARAAGEASYRRDCSACHQGDGGGLPGVFPPLARHAPRLLAAEGGRDYLIDVVLYGLAGEITVDGSTYQSLMPGLAHLDDEAVANALTYSLLAWGNEDELPDDVRVFEPEDIAARRGQNLRPQDMLRARGELDLD